MFTKVIAFILILLIIFLPGYFKLHKLRVKNNELTRQIEKLNKANLELSDRLNKLQNDPVYVEGLAREKLRVAGKDETVYKVVP